MEQTIFASTFDKTVKQRNFFIITSCLLLLSTLFLSITVSQKSTTVVMIPGLEVEMSVSNTHISKSFLERTCYMFLPCLLDLTPDTITYKSETILKYTTSRGMKEIENYFSKQAQKLKKFKISTYFTPKYLEINDKKLEVKVVGILTSTFGNEGRENEEAEFLLTFEHKGGILKLDKFLPITTKGN